MIRWISLSLCILFLSNLNAQSKKDIRLYKIKEMTETTVLYENGKQTVTYKSELKKFDKEGNTVENITYNSDGSIRRKEASKYSGKNKVEELVQDVNTTKKDHSEEESTGKYKHNTTKYNSNDDKTEEIWYDEKGTVIRKITYAYNSKGDRLVEITYDGAGKMTQKIVYGYDVKGLRTEKKVYVAGDILVKHVRYTYTF
jgi:hypothetical protein